ncbi:hypothetical protein LBMAG42_42930 [Deltaproteobacteria bacterium]|nr:hypothetical protein LBMAG42_42930 [Deltaproteobacteria bacterium]
MIVVLWFTLGLAQDEEVVPTGGTVDATAYLNALRTRFMDCATAEGTPLSADDQAAVDDVIRTVAPILPWTGASTCTASDAAVADCAAAVSASSCTRLATDLEQAIRGGFSSKATPTWAVAYGYALGDRVAACYAEETGTPLAESDQLDIDGFSAGIAGALGGLAASCPVDTAKAETCRAAVAGMECAALATAINSEDTELIVNALVQGCPGFLDCE